MDERLKKLRDMLGVEDDSTLESRRLEEAYEQNLGKIDLRNLKERASGGEIPQAPLANKPAMPSKAYTTQYPSDEKFEAARQRAGGASMRSPGAMDSQRLKELQNQLDMVESEEAFDGPTKQSEEQKMRLRALIQKLGGS